MYYTKESLIRYFDVIENQKMIDRLKDINKPLIHISEFDKDLSVQEVRTMQTAVVGYLPSIK